MTDSVLLHHRLTQVARQMPAQQAVVAPEGTLTYGELEKVSSRLALGIAPLLGRAGRVLICLPPGLEFVTTMVAVLKAGGTYVPLYHKDPGDRLNTLANLPDADLMILDRDVQFKPDSGLPLTTAEALYTQAGLTTAVKRNAAGSPPDGSGHAYIIHTSGSTGTPKAMGISHQAVANLLAAFEAICPLNPEHRCSLWCSLHFDVSVYEIWSALLSGATLFIPEDRIRFSPETYLEWLARHRITSAYLPPFMIEPLAASDLKFSLKRLLTGVEPLPEPLLCRIKSQIAGLALINGYGPAETAVCATLYPVPDIPSRKGRAPIGRPVKNMEIQLVDDQGQPVPRGEKGEILIRGIQVADGYINAPGLSARAFDRRNGSMVYRTGDMGMELPDGNLVFLGRRDFQIKFKGVRIEPGEIEGLARQHPQISQAALIPKTLENGKPLLILYATPGHDQQPSSDAVTDFLAGKLPREMMPSAVVILETLPFTPQGKTDRTALARRQDPELMPARDNRPSRPSSPVSHDQNAMARIWEQVLESPVRTGNENFLLLGGDSISAARIMARINQKYRTDLPLTFLFDHPEFNRFSGQVTAMAGTESLLPESPESGDLPPDRPIPLLPDQELIWLFETLHPKTCVYHIPLVFEVAGDIDPDRLEQAVNRAAMAHPALGFSTVMDQDRLFQKWTAPRIKITLTDLGSQEPNLFFRLDDPGIRKWLDKEIRRPFNLSRGPLLRAALLRVEPQLNILCLTFHHIGFDGWSAGLFTETLGQAYTHLVPDTTPPSSRKTRTAPDPVPALETYRSHVLARKSRLFRQWPKARVFFTDYLARLPGTGDAAQDERFDARTCPIDLNISLYVKIKAMARQQQSSRFALLLAIFQLALAVHTKQADQVTGIAYAGRDRLDAEGIAGCLMNTLVVRNTVLFQTSFIRFLTQMKQTLAKVFTHKDIPIHTLQAFCRKQGQTGPIFDALFLMQTMPLGPLTLGDLETRRHPESAPQANTGLTLELYETATGASGWLKYRTDRYSEAEARQLAQTFIAVAQLVMDCPDERLETLTADMAEAVRDEAQIDRLAQDILSAAEFPLSPMQHGMLMETLRSPQGAGCYVEQVVFDMDEDIDLARFQTAWNNIFTLHETLRLGFAWQGKDTPVQYLAPAHPLRIDFNDWSNFGADQIQDYLGMFLKADRRLGFSMDHPPALRVALFKTGKTAFTCVWSFHHSIGDGRSMAFILDHLFRLYRNPETSVDPPAPFRGYIAWLYTRRRTQARQFWRAYLSGFTDPLVFPFRTDDDDIGSSRRQSHAMALTTGHHHLTLSPVTCRRIKTVCQENGLSINAFLMGVWAVLLSHYTGKTDVVFGATVSTRHFNPSHKAATGLYINTLPVRIKVAPDQPLIEYVADIRNQWTQIRAHDHMSLTDIHALSPIQGSAPLSEIYFSYDYKTLDEALAPAKPEISCSRVRLLERTPAAIFLTASGVDNLCLSIEYDQRKFSARTTRQILDHFSHFLKTCTQAPETPLRRLPVLTEPESALIQEKLNTGQGHLPPTSCFHQLFEIQAGINPDAPAVTDGQITYTFGQLNGLANQVARLLLNRGTGQETKVLVLLDQTPELIAVIIGILKAGACYVPVDTGAPEERIRYIIQDCQPQLAMTSSAWAPKLADTSVLKFLLDNDAIHLRNQDQTNPDRPVLPGHLAYIIYTSGTTGKPKGVMIEHQALAAFTKAAAQTYDLMPTDRILQFASISFDASAEEIFPTLLTGATLVTKPKDLILTPQAFFTFCEAREISILDLPTAYWHVIADEIKSLTLPPLLRLIIIGGDAAHPEKLANWQAAVGSRVRLFNTYGPTETTVAATWADLTEAVPENSIVPIGGPFPSVNLAILNHFLQPAPPGVTGELYIGGPQVGRGYLNREKETHASFVTLKDPGSHIRFFKTGDYAKMLPSGQVIFLGRRDRQVKIRGFRVEPGEIEQTLAAGDLIKDAAIVVTAPPGGDVRLTAFVVPAPHTGTDEAQIRTWLQTRLPDYMIPAAFILVKALPHTASNKVDYTLLTKSLMSQAAEPVRTGAPDQTTVEEAPAQNRFLAGLSDIWEEILNTGRFGPEDNFFDVGGSSLSAIRLVTAIEKRFGITLPILAVFKFPKLKDLARQLEDKNKSTHFSSVTPVSAQGEKPPIFFVAGTEEDTRAWEKADLDGHPLYKVTVFAHKSRNKEIIPMDIWEIARKNVKEILQAHARGPYIIIGFCRYCVVAYEIAAQLTARGKQVEQLVFLDEFWQKKSRPPAHAAPAKPGLRQRLKELIPKTRQALRDYAHSLNKKREQYYTVTGKSVPDTLQASLMESSFWKAYDGYLPLPYPGDLLVLDTDNWEKEYNPRLRTYVQGRIRQIRVHAAHDDWFAPAQVRRIVGALGEFSGEE